MAALANFFRIRPAFFTDDEYYEKLDKELSWLLVIRDEGVGGSRFESVGCPTRRNKTSFTAPTSYGVRNTWKPDGSRSARHS